MRGHVAVIHQNLGEKTFAEVLKDGDSGGGIGFSRSQVEASAKVFFGVIGRHGLNFNQITCKLSIKQFCYRSITGVLHFVFCMQSRGLIVRLLSDDELLVAEASLGVDFLVLDKVPVDIVSKVDVGRDADFSYSLKDDGICALWVVLLYDFSKLLQRAPFSNKHLEMLHERGRHDLVVDCPFDKVENTDFLLLRR